MGQFKDDLMNGILFTDQYQLTMAQLYYRVGLHEKTAQFEHFFRRYPNYGTHQAGYCINAGLEWLLKWMESARFGTDEIALLRGQQDGAGGQLFGDDFLAWLAEYGHFGGLSLQAIPEGRVVHPFVPLTEVRGPLALAQILETSLLNHLNYQTLIATKASRMAESGRGRPLLEFGLRRGQGMGANAGSRAALVGGADFSSNVGVSHSVGLQAKGTHAHSMVQMFMALGMNELDAFRAYADVYPDDCLLLVDTLDTLQSGVPHAIQVFEELRRQGHKPVGIRLDSGDLAYLSIQASKMLDEAGFSETAIVLSNDLDELVIWQVLTQISQEAPRFGVDADRLTKRLIYGVGTRLTTSWGEPALGGVYKLVAVEDQGKWQPAIKISESPEKTPLPGQKQVIRLYDQHHRATADLIRLEDETVDSASDIELRHPIIREKRRVLTNNEVLEHESLLVDILVEGKKVYDPPSLAQIRQQRKNDLSHLDSGVRRLINPHIYHVSVTPELWNLKQGLIENARR